MNIEKKKVILAFTVLACGLLILIFSTYLPEVCVASSSPLGFCFNRVPTNIIGAMLSIIGAVLSIVSIISFNPPADDQVEV